MMHISKKIKSLCITFLTNKFNFLYKIHNTQKTDLEEGRFNAIFFVNCAALLILILVFLTSILRPIITFDSWMYHLPFSSYLFHIGGGEEGFIMSDKIKQIYVGYPKVAEWLQGLFWYVTGVLNTVTIINSLSLILLICYMVKKTNIIFSNLVFGFLSMPLIAINVRTSNIDLFAGVLLAFQVMSSAFLFDEISNRRKNNLLSFNISDLIIFSLAAILVGNTKYMSWVVSFFALLFFLISIIRNWKYKQARLIGFIVIAVLFLSSATIIKNYINFKNPFYPYSVTLPILGFKIKGNIEEYRQYPGYASNFGFIERPVNFLLSITELDWQLREVKKFYNSSSNTGDNPKRYKPARTGGLWGFYIIANLLIFFYLIWFQRRRNIKLTYFEKYIIGIFIYITSIISFMPQSHELRYYLLWPLLLITLNVYFISIFVKRSISLNALTLWYCFCFFVTFTSLPSREISVNPLPIISFNKESMRKVSDKRILDLLEIKKGICLGPEFTPSQFRYSRAMIGGDHRIEQVVNNWEKCRMFEEFKY